MDFREGDVELLVHVTAPTTAAGDDDHRALARAYMGFVPARTTKLSDPDDIGIASSVDVVEDSFVEQPSRQDGVIQTPPVEFAPDDRMPYRGGDDAGLGLNLDPVSGGHSGEAFDDSSDGNVVPASQAEQRDSIIDEVADSYPHASVSLDPFVSPTRILEHHLRRIRSSGQQKRLFEDDTGQGQAGESELPRKAARTQTLEVLQFPLQSLRSHEPDSSPLRDVYPTVASTSSPICDSPLADGPFNGVTSASTVAMTSTRDGSPIRDTIKGPALSEPSLRRHQSERGTRTATNPAAPPLTRSTSAPSAGPSPADLTSYKKKFSALEAHPPQPAVSVDHLSGSSLLTPRLKDLAEITPLEQVYHPKFHPSTGEGTSKESDLRPLQRGYWLLDLSAWDEHSRWATWARLHGHISRGDLGWGIWSCRDEPCVLVRMYCFASFAGHVYLVLNDASGGKLRGMEVKWIGDEGRPRMTVPATEGV